MQLLALGRWESYPFQRVQMLCQQPGKRHNLSELFHATLAKAQASGTSCPDTGGTGKGVRGSEIAAVGEVGCSKGSRHWQQLGDNRDACTLICLQLAGGRCGSGGLWQMQQAQPYDQTAEYQEQPVLCL